MQGKSKEKANVRHCVSRVRHLKRLNFICLPSRGTADWFGVSKDGDSTQRWRRKSLQHCGQLYGGLKAQVMREMELRSQDNLSLASTETPPPLYLPPLHPSQQHCGIQRVGLPRLGRGYGCSGETLSPWPDAPSHCFSSILGHFFHLFHLFHHLVVLLSHR